MVTLAACEGSAPAKMEAAASVEAMIMFFMTNLSF
jgi:hypothetical protein